MPEDYEYESLVERENEDLRKKNAILAEQMAEISKKLGDLPEQLKAAIHSPPPEKADAALTASDAHAKYNSGEWDQDRFREWMGKKYAPKAPTRTQEAAIKKYANASPKELDAAYRRKELDADTFNRIVEKKYGSEK